jgi:hypothetical protein
MSSGLFYSKPATAPGNQTLREIGGKLTTRSRADDW